MILAAANHANIVQLVAAYTHKGKHNSIFPLADVGSLASILYGRVYPAWLVATEASCENRTGLLDFLVAVSDLSAAFCCMHTLNTNMLHNIGCHRDLKPSNILIDKKKFLLSDFGLA